MKAFLEEYGLVIVIVIVVAMLIGVAWLVSTNGKAKMQDTFEKFTGIGDKAVQDAVDAAGNKGTE